MTILFAVLGVIASIAVIYYGANFFTDGASSMAKKLHVSSMVIGLTVVAFGTSAPELAVSLTSAIKGSSGISLGNIVGSNIFNVLVVLGLTLLICPIAIQRSTAKIEMPFLILLSILLVILAKDTSFLGGHADIISRLDGLVFIILLGIFFIYILRLTKHHQKHTTKTNNEPPIKEYSWLASIGLFLLGLAMLVGGGVLFTNSAVAIAEALHVSEAVIGVTLVAAGTSIPELATTLVAARKKQVDMAVGNIVGSNILNILLIEGLVSVIQPVDASGITLLDMWSMVGAVVLLTLLTFVGKRYKLNYISGIILLLGYVVYAVCRLTVFA